MKLHGITNNEGCDTGSTLLMRSLLFVPGHVKRYLDKALQCNADVLLLDLEDSVPMSEKEHARSNIVEYVCREDRKPQCIFPRVNDVESGELLRDIQALTIPGVDGFMFPKGRDEKDIFFFSQLLEAIEREKGIPPGTFKIIPLIETTMALSRIVEICHSTSRIVAVAFGSEDFLTDVHGKRDPDAANLAVARALVSIHARASGVLPIDTVYTSVHDENGLEKHILQGKGLGYGGMLAVSPRELPLINALYSPSAEELKEAEMIIKRVEEAKKSGRGIVLNEKDAFIGPPAVKRAAYIIQQASCILSRSPE